MPTKTLPLTTYSVRQNKPNQKFGSPARLPIQDGESQVFARVPLDKVPLGATITSAIVRFYSATSPGGQRIVRALPVTSSWSASITWAKRPSVGAVLDTETRTNPASWDLDVTAWAQTRSRRGLRIDTTGAKHLLRGSSAASGKPVLIVTYTEKPQTPGALTPNGGSVSVPQPVLSYAADDDVTEQAIEFSTDGISPSASTGWLPSPGRFDASMAAGVQPVLVDGGAGIWWRVTTRGPEGTSDPSAWAFYDFRSLPVVTITAPGATSSDGSPTLQWTVASMEAFSATLQDGDGAEVDSTDGFVPEDTDRFWTPSGTGVKVPDGVGKFTLTVRDSVSPRVSAIDAPTEVTVTHEFTTTLTGAGAPIDSLTVSWDDPVPLLTGSRAAGIPDEVALVRDGVLVPIWTPDGEVYPKWAPAGALFSGTAFTIPDYTSEPRHEHTWEVRVKVNGVVSSAGPTVTAKPHTGSVWLVNPRTGEKVEVQGWNGEPAVEQETSEASILHVPINGGLQAEPIRRRLIRTTKAGSISGVVLNDDEQTLNRWVEGDSGDRFRLVFGKVNWTVIIGDYSPSDVFYPDACGPDRVLVALNWWQRRGVL